MPSYSFTRQAAGEIILDTDIDELQEAIEGLALSAVAVSFKTNDDQYFVCPDALTLSTPVERGTGTLAYAKAVSATPTTFVAISSWPATFAAGDILRVTSTGVSGYKAATLPRTA